ncbi:MAG TPA: class I SAM-dependent methyltransferase [Allosphingosinicella sp.]
MGGASEEIISLYERTAAAWMEARGAQAAERSWMDRLTAGLGANDAILDIGCGHGVPLAAELVRRGFRVTGVDSSPSLIAAARANVPDAEFQVADMRRLALGRRFDALLAWHSFFHLAADDQRAMFPIFAAHAAPGARLMFTSGPEASEAIGEWQGEPLHHASLSPHEYRDLLVANGFVVESFSGPGQDATVWTALYMRPASGLEGSA